MAKVPDHIDVQVRYTGIDLDAAEVERRFRYYPPTTGARAEQHREVRAVIWRTAQFVVGTLPPGRETSLAITHLEEAMFWANAALARSPSE